MVLPVSLEDGDFQQERFDFSDLDATEFERTMKSLGIDGFASKPFTQAQLLAAVDKLIRDLA